jgi:riboflavin biosynthesis pyrimidine reductase
VRRLHPDPSDELTDDDLLEAYAHEPGRLRMNFVSSADGAVTVEGKSAGLSGPADKRVFGLLRDLADVVLVAAGTVREEGYGYPEISERRRERRRAMGLAEWPTFAVMTRSRNLDLSSSLFQDPPVPTLVVDDLSGLAGKRILCEGGPTLFGSLLADGLVDELCLTIAPVLAGAGPARIIGGPEQSPTRLRTEHVLAEDGFLFLRYAVGD